MGELAARTKQILSNILHQLPFSCAEVISRGRLRRSEYAVQFEVQPACCRIISGNEEFPRTIEEMKKMVAKFPGGFSDYEER
jgi:hypothetical protein